MSPLKRLYVLLVSGDEFIKAEYDFQEKTPRVERIGSSCKVGIKSSALSFKSKHDQLTDEAAEIIDLAQKRFPYMSYVGCSVFKEIPATKQIGEVMVFRTIPRLS